MPLGNTVSITRLDGESQCLRPYHILSIRRATFVRDRVTRVFYNTNGEVSGTSLNRYNGRHIERVQGSILDLNSGRGELPVLDDY